MVRLDINTEFSERIETNVNFLKEAKAGRCVVVHVIKQGEYKTVPGRDKEIAKDTDFIVNSYCCQLFADIASFFAKVYYNYISKTPIMETFKEEKSVKFLDKNAQLLILLQTDKELIDRHKQVEITTKVVDRKPVYSLTFGGKTDREITKGAGVIESACELFTGKVGTDRYKKEILITSEEMLEDISKEHSALLTDLIKTGREAFTVTKKYVDRTAMYSKLTELLNTFSNSPQEFITLAQFVEDNKHLMTNIDPNTFKNVPNQVLVMLLGSPEEKISYDYPEGKPQVVGLLVKLAQGLINIDMDRADFKNLEAVYKTYQTVADQLPTDKIVKFNGTDQSLQDILRFELVKIRTVMFERIKAPIDKELGALEGLVESIRKAKLEQETILAKIEAKKNDLIARSEDFQKSGELAGIDNGLSSGIRALLNAQSDLVRMYNPGMGLVKDPIETLTTLKAQIWSGIENTKVETTQEVRESAAVEIHMARTLRLSVKDMKALPNYELLKGLYEDNLSFSNQQLEAKKLTLLTTLATYKNKAETLQKQITELSKPATIGFFSLMNKAEKEAKLKEINAANAANVKLLSSALEGTNKDMTLLSQQIKIFEVSIARKGNLDSQSPVRSKDVLITAYTFISDVIDMLTDEKAAKELAEKELSDLSQLSSNEEQITSLRAVTDNLRAKFHDFVNGNIRVEDLTPAVKAAEALAV